MRNGLTFDNPQRASLAGISQLIADAIGLPDDGSIVLQLIEKGHVTVAVAGGVISWTLSAEGKFALAADRILGGTA